MVSGVAPMPESECLSGGGWRSATFLQYLSSEDVEDRLAMEQAFMMSDEEHENKNE